MNDGEIIIKIALTFFVASGFFLIVAIVWCNK